MGFKTVIGPQGVVTTNIFGGDNELVTSIVQKKTITVVSESGNATISALATLLRPMNAAGVTASLPNISDVLVGAEYLVLKNSGSFPMLLSGTSPIVGTVGLAVGAWTCPVSQSGGRYSCLAISGSTGYQWFLNGASF